MTDHQEEFPTRALLAFYEERLAEREARARIMAGAIWPTEIAVCPTSDTGPPQDGEPVGHVVIGPEYSKAYARVWNPTQVAKEEPRVDDTWHRRYDAIDAWSAPLAGQELRNIAADRKLLDLFTTARERTETTAAAGEFVALMHAGAVSALLDVLKTKAAAYDNLPGYDERWRP